MEKIEAKGSPTWMTTYADLMTLLMCFFVLLFSYSVVDIQKFKQIAGSIKYGFGVQDELIFESIPKGVSPIFNEYSPSLPPKNNPIEPKELNQQEADIPLNLNDNASSPFIVLKNKLLLRFDSLFKGKHAEIVLKGDQLILRLRNSSLFPSGSSFIQPQFVSMLENLASELLDVDGKIIIAGHTDDLLITENTLYKDNWALSQARAKSVFDVMNKVKGFEKNRFKLEAYADSQPIVENLDEESRAQNRRVEIVIVKLPKNIN